MISNLVFKNTVLFSVLLMVSCSSSGKNIENRENKIKITSEKPNQGIQTGAENYTAYLPLLKDKKVGIVTNQTGVLNYYSPEETQVNLNIVDFLLAKRSTFKKSLLPNMGSEVQLMPANMWLMEKIPKPDCLLFRFMAITKNQKLSN